MLRPIRLCRDSRDHIQEHFLRRLGVRHQVSDDNLCGNRFFFDLPAIVIGNHCHGGERDFRFARQFRFRNICHPDHVKTVPPIQLRFRARGKCRTIHIHVSAAIVDCDAERPR